MTQGARDGLAIEEETHVLLDDRGEEVAVLLQPTTIIVCSFRASTILSE